MDRQTGAVVVLFHPDEATVERVEVVRRQTDRVVVVDNTPELDEDLHRRLTQPGLCVLANRNRGGLGRAYNLGVSKLVADGCELVFLFDQDSEIGDTHVERMIAATAPIAHSEYLVGPRIYEVRADTYMADGAAADDHDEGLHPTELLISSGCGVSSAAFQRLGEFREDFFIEWIDVEYCYRAREAGVARYVNPGVVLRQYQGDITRYGPVVTTNHPAWRRYYSVRNGLWVNHHYVRGGAALRGGIRFVLRELVVSVCFERAKARKVFAILAGALDGLRDRLGPLESCRPLGASLIGR